MGVGIYQETPWEPPNLPPSSPSAYAPDGRDDHHSWMGDGVVGGLERRGRDFRGDGNGDSIGAYRGVNIFH